MHAFRNLQSPTIIAAQSPILSGPLQLFPQALPCPLGNQVNTIESSPLFDVSQLEPYVPEPPRVPRRFREVRYIPGEPGKVRNIVRRLPTPPQQIIERVNFVPAPQPVINCTRPTFVQQTLPATTSQVVSQQTTQLVSHAAPQFIAQPASQIIAHQAPQIIAQPAQQIIAQPVSLYGGCNNIYPYGAYLGY